MMLGRHFSWEAVVKYLTLATVGAYVSPLLRFMCILFILFKIGESYRGFFSPMLEKDILFYYRLGIGIVFGTALVLWLALVFNDPMINLSLTLAVSYIVYFTVSENLYLDYLHRQA